jgi:hypothetical protein
MTLTKKLLLLSLSCFALVFVIVFFETNVTQWLSDKPVIFKTTLSWTFGLLVFTGGIIPFGIWAVSISNWYEGMRDVSSIYGKKDSN